MKTNFLRKAKWYIVGFILIAVMLSVSLSFCAWDSLSFKAIMNANGGDFKEKSAWSDCIKDKDGNDLPDIPTVGTIVTYGKFYQTANATEPTEPLKWIVVDYNATTKVATLLADKVVVYGNYWGTGGGSIPYQNDYYRSTVRSWLNSGKGSLMANGSRYDDNKRSDGLTSTTQLNKGFLDVAFTGGAETILVPKKITGMKYVVSGTNDSNKVLGECYTNGGNNTEKSISDLVWLPSHNEMYGSTYGSTQMDDTSDKHFKYFSTNTANRFKVAGTTNYAWNNGIGTSYYNTSGTGGGSNNSYQSTAWHWLRSPDPSTYRISLVVHIDGSGGSNSNTNTAYPHAGVRPAVNVQL